MTVKFKKTDLSSVFSQKNIWQNKQKNFLHFMTNIEKNNIVCFVMVCVKI